jgi:hypothetical protein
VIVRFVDIDGIDHQHCLSFLFIVDKTRPEYHSQIQSNNKGHTENLNGYVHVII